MRFVRQVDQLNQTVGFHMCIPDTNSSTNSMLCELGALLVFILVGRNVNNK